MSNWIFLSKDGNDEYVNMFANGCNTTPVSTDNFDYSSSKNPIVLRGILKHKIMKQCWDKKELSTILTLDIGATKKQIQIPTDGNTGTELLKIIYNTVKLLPGRVIDLDNSIKPFLRGNATVVKF
jgi:hypothetical protein